MIVEIIKFLYLPNFYHFANSQKETIIDKSIFVVKVIDMYYIIYLKFAKPSNAIALFFSCIAWNKIEANVAWLFNP